jgi:hypothetical protein
MKPQGWDQFLQQIALDYELRGRLKDLFLVRFAYENWRKPDKEVWELAEAPSHETYKKQMTELYHYFSNDKPHGCPELDPKSKGPGKFQMLREWLKDFEYPEWQKNAATRGFQRVEASPSATYIQRPSVENDCYQEILQPGSLIRIKAPEKMGKTTLLKSILAQAESYGYRQVYLNLRAAEAAMFTSLDKFLRWFCANVSRELGIKPMLDDYWDEELFGSLVSCKTYFQGYLLENLGSPLVLGLDNVDRIFEYAEIAQDFLPMLRYWHEEANNIVVWQNLRMVIANSTEVYFKLDANQSPFNVGRQIKLSGLKEDQIKTLAEAYHLEEQDGLDLEQFITNLLAMVKGHPYLVRLAFEALSRQSISPQQLLETAPTQGGIYSAHLRRHWDNLQQQPELAEAMKKVVNEASGVQLEPATAYKLESMGLVTLLGDQVKPSCQLYQQYFKDNL